MEPSQLMRRCIRPPWEPGIADIAPVVEQLAGV